MIELARQRGFDVLSITHHDRVFHDDDLVAYARERANHLNKKAVERAEAEGLPLIGTSDAHSRWQLGTTYSLIEAGKEVESIMSAIRAKHVEVVTKPLPIYRLPHMGLKPFTHMFNGIFS